MKKLLPIIIVLFFTACSTYISSSEESELNQAARQYFSEKHEGYAPADVLGTKVSRDGESYRVIADTDYNEQRKTVPLVFKRVIDSNGNQYWEVVFPR